MRVSIDSLDQHTFRLREHVGEGQVREHPEMVVARQPVALQGGALQAAEEFCQLTAAAECGIFFFDQRSQDGELVQTDRS